MSLRPIIADDDSFPCCKATGFDDNLFRKSVKCGVKISY